MLFRSRSRANCIARRTASRDFAVLTVTIPTAESRDAVRRAMQFARERGADLLGVVENMVDGPFTGDAGEALAREFAVPVLARVPFQPSPAVWDDLARRIGSPG